MRLLSRCCNSYRNRNTKGQRKSEERVGNEYVLYCKTDLTSIVEELGYS
jgi:hypothetical protein